MASQIPDGTFAKVVRLPLCDVCKRKGKEVNATYDAKVQMLGGIWANLCIEHFQVLECQLGTGLGQQLLLVE